MSEILFPSAQRRPYYIIAPDYSRVSAGVKVIHLLCHLLNLRGQCAYVTTQNVNGEWVTPILTEAIVQRHFDEGRTPIVVYGEVITGNPAQAGCVVRYLLNYPGLLGGQTEFGPEEMLIWYSEQMRKECEGRGSVLSLPVTDARLFTPPPEGAVRRGTCYYGEKYKVFSGKPLPPPVEGSVEILREGPGVQTREELIELFRTSELFYCYESSALSLEAILCGCPTVLVPNDHYKKPILLESIGLTGMAWGDSAEEIERAKRTAPQMREKYDEWIESALRQLDHFVRETQTKALATPYVKKICFPVDALGSSMAVIQWAIQVRKVLLLITPPIVRLAISARNMKTLARLLIPPIVLASIWHVSDSLSGKSHKYWVRNVLSQILPSPSTKSEGSRITRALRQCAPPVVFDFARRISGRSASVKG